MQLATVRIMKKNSVERTKPCRNFNICKLTCQRERKTHQPYHCHHNHYHSLPTPLPFVKDTNKKRDSMRNCFLFLLSVLNRHGINPNPRRRSDGSPLLKVIALESVSESSLRAAFACPLRGKADVLIVVNLPGAAQSSVKWEAGPNNLFGGLMNFYMPKSLPRALPRLRILSQFSHRPLMINSMLKLTFDIVPS